MALREQTLRGSISAEAARRKDGLEFSQLELTDRLQRLGCGAVLSGAKSMKSLIMLIYL